jgi:hypothetical protein
MSLPEWGNSYNALYVPLTSAWQCALVPARDVEEPGSWWRLTYDQRQQKRKEMEKQIEDDRGAFLRLFRVIIHKRNAPASSDFREYAAFIRNTLRASIWSPPVDGDGVVRVLGDAVRDGQLIPVINRRWRGSQRVSRRYAPQSWPKRAPDPKPIIYGVRDGQFVPLNADGSFVDYAAYMPVAARAAAIASSAAGSASSSAHGAGLLGMAEAAAGNLLDDDSEEDFSSDASNDSTQPGDAQPFEYSDDSTGRDVTDLAARGVSEAEEAECDSIYDAEMTACQAANAMFRDPRSYALCSQRAFQNYQACRGYS